MSEYEVLREHHLTELAALAPQVVGRVGWPPERLASHRTSCLRQVLRAAGDRSPWHAKRLAQVDPDTFDESALTTLPIMTKDDLMANFDDIVTDKRLSLDLVETHLEGLSSDDYLLDHYHAVASSGASGRRGVFVYDSEGWTLVYLGIMRMLLRSRALDPALAAAPLVLATVGAENPTHVTSSVFQTFSNPQAVNHRIPVTTPLDEMVARLNDAQPTFLLGYPSVLYGLTHEAKSGRLRIAPRRVGVGAEPLFPEIRSTLEETWGSPVVNVWGASECGAVGTSCDASPGIHLNEDLVVVEAVDEANRPVPPGSRAAKVLLTNLFNTTLPLIRYEVTDEMTVLEDQSCPCGSGFLRVEDVQGRLDDTFHYGDVSVHPHVFRSALGRQRHVVEYQVRQTARGADVSLCCVGPVDMGALRTQIVESLDRLGLPSADVSITAVDRIERLGTGKLRRFVALP